MEGGDSREITIALYELIVAASRAEKEAANKPTLVRLRNSLKRGVQTALNKVKAKVLKKKHKDLQQLMVWLANLLLEEAKWLTINTGLTPKGRHVLMPNIKQLCLLFAPTNEEQEDIGLLSDFDAIRSTECFATEALVNYTALRLRE